MFVSVQFLLLVSVQSIFSQESIEDTTTYEIKGRHFYKYVVEPGNTVYGISRMYDVSVHDIQEHNPQTANGLSVGDTLYILAMTKDKESMKTRMEVNGDIIVHEVQKKQTLYAISKIYGLSVSDIMEVNPEIKRGLKEGQLIKIPISKLKEEKEALPVIDENKYIIHEVQSKETLYSLSRIYNISIDSIKAANKGLPEGLKVGQVIAIPKSEGIRVAMDTSLLKDRYKVVFILPYFLDMNDTLISKLKIDDRERLYSKSVISLQFYQGAMLAIDSMKNLGYKFDVSFYDSAKDTARITKLIKENKLKDADLIIGPFYLSQFLKVAEYAKKHKIHMVCPVPQNNKVLLGNPYASKVATSRNILFKNLGGYTAQLFRTENIVLIQKRYRADPLTFAFRAEFLKALEKKGDTVNIKNISEVRWDNGSIDAIKLKLLKDSALNVLVVPSNDQVYVTELLAKLNAISGKYYISVIGQDGWLRYSNIDFDYLENLHVMVPVDGFVEYDRPEVQAFVKKYNQLHGVFPERFAFQGFDVAWYYFDLLKNSGNRIENTITEIEGHGLYFDFDFFKTGLESGFENSSTTLLKYEDYELKKVSTSKKE